MPALRSPLARLRKSFRPSPAGGAARRGMLLALAIGTVGGAAGAALGLPLPWMLGPMIVCAGAALAGVPVVGPARARPIVVPVLGVMLGAGFTPEIWGHLGAWAGTFALLPAFVVVAGLAGWVFYRRIGGYDARTAFFCAAPGGLNEMMILGAEAGADERRVSLAHAVRIFVVVAVVALAFALLGGTTTAGLSRSAVAFSDLSVTDGLALLACAVAGSRGARALGLPAAPLLGPMALSAGLHLSGLVTEPPPTLLVIVAQVVIGTLIGSRFAGATLRDTGRDIALAAGAALVMLAVTLVFAFAVMALTGAPWSQALLAYAPGGLAEMSLLALAKNQDVAYVATAHVARIVIVLFLVPPLFRLSARHLPPPEGEGSCGAATQKDK